MAEQQNNEATQEQTQQPQSGQTTTGGADNAKAFGIIGYIIPLLFFLPLVTDTSTNDFARYHANQQLNLLLFWVVINAIAIIPILGWIIAFVGWIFGIVLLIMGVINVANGDKKPLPLIGGFELIK